MGTYLAKQQNVLLKVWCWPWPHGLVLIGSRHNILNNILQPLINQKHLKLRGPARCNQRIDQIKPNVTWMHVAQTEDPWAFSKVAVFIMVMLWELFELSQGSSGWSWSEHHRACVFFHGGTRCRHNNEQKLSRNKAMRLLTTAGVFFVCLFIS